MRGVKGSLRDGPLLSLGNQCLFRTKGGPGLYVFMKTLFRPKDLVLRENLGASLTWARARLPDTLGPACSLARLGSLAFFSTEPLASLFG